MDPEWSDSVEGRRVGGRIGTQSIIIVTCKAPSFTQDMMGVHSEEPTKGERQRTCDSTNIPQSVYEANFWGNKYTVPPSMETYLDVVMRILDAYAHDVPGHCRTSVLCLEPFFIHKACVFVLF